MKASKLIGTQLDWAVAKCEEINSQICRTNSCAEEKQGIKTHAIKYNQTWNAQRLERWSTYAPSTDWSQSGPIIEREGIELLCNLTTTEASRFSGGASADWQAFHRSDRRTEARQFATTPLIAAMRCYVARKLGDEVEIPEELK